MKIESCLRLDIFRPFCSVDERMWVRLEEDLHRERALIKC